MILNPEQYNQVSTYDLLCAAEQGFVGIDHRFLHAIVGDPQKATPDLLRFGLEKRQGGRENLDEDLVQIFRYLRAPAGIPFLIEFVRRTEDLTVPLVSAFRAIGEPAIGPLLECYNPERAGEASNICYLLAGLGVRDPRILDLLLRRLEIDPVDAAHCLAPYGDPAAIPAMRDAVHKVKDDWAVIAIKWCVDELEHGTDGRDDEPFDLWELYPEKAFPRFDLLSAEETESFLDSLDAENRAAALDALYGRTAPSRLWDRLLRMARNDPDPRVRGKCWVALIDAWERTDVQQAMRTCLADETASVEERMGALLSLAGRDGDNPEIRRRIVEFYERPDVRAEALEAMVNTQDPAFARYFRQHLDDSDHDVSAKAMLGIGMLGIESEAPRLAAYFKDDRLRGEALPAYALCARSEPTRAGLRRLFRKIDDLSGGLSIDEEDAVKEALNTRAWRYDLEPVFGDDGEPLVDDPVKAKAKVGRNDPCPCGSGKKYKKCCGG